MIEENNVQPSFWIHSWHRLMWLVIFYIPGHFAFSASNLDSLEAHLERYPSDTHAILAYVDGMVAIRSLDMPRAEAIGNKAIALAKAIPDDRVLGHAYNNLANSYSQVGRFEEALATYQLAIETYQRSNSRPDLAKIYMNIGSTYLHMQNHDQAEIWLLKAKKNIENDTSPASLSVLNNNLALVYSFRGQYEEAITMHLECLAFEEETGKIRSQALSHNNIGYAYQQMGQHARALKSYRRAYAIAKATHYELETSYIMVSLIDGLVHNKLYVEADQMADTLQNLARKISARNLVAEVYKTVAGVYQEQGKYEEALEQYALYIALHDSLLNEDQNDRIASLQSKVEVAERDAEIEIMEREKIADANNAATQKGYIFALIGSLVVAFGILLLLTISHRARKRANVELQSKNALVREQYEALRFSNERLADLNREKDGLIGIVAHDLKSPLNKSSALTELIASVGPLNPQQEQALDMIRKVTAHGNDLIRDLLDLNSIEHPESELLLGEVDLKDLLQEGAASFEAAARQKDIDLQWFAAEAQAIETDRKALNRVLENLVSNAIKFSPRGKKVWVEAHVEGAQVHLSVQDEGPGITSEDRKNLFKKFQRLSARPTAGENSTGLGLAITKTLVEKLGGSIAVESKPGMGAKFVVVLPRSKA